MPREARLSSTLLALAGAVFLIHPASVPATAASGVRPNILLIVTDDQRGSVPLMMPQTNDHFGRRGTRFTRAFATTPLCCPARASILTGRYAHNHDVLGNREDPALLRAAQDEMVQRYLHDAGYRTGLFGKFLNNWPNDTDPANFDRWATTPFVRFSGAEWNVNGSTRVVEQNSTSYVGDRAVEFLDGMESADDTPWFLHVGFMAPHLPATVESRYHNIAIPELRLVPAMTERDRGDKPPYVRQRPIAHPEKIRSRRAKQLRSLAAVDDQVERIMSALGGLGERDDTLAIFLSDNGYQWGDHGLFGKATPYLPSVRTALYVSWPGMLEQGAVDDRLVGGIDLAPTMLSAAGLQPAGPLDGINLLDPEARRARLLLEYWRIPDHFVPSWTGFISRRHSYVEYVDDEGRLTFSEFYRLRSDPQQLVNVLRDGERSNDPDVERLAEILDRLEVCSGTSCPH